MISNPWRNVDRGVSVDDFHPSRCSDLGHRLMDSTKDPGQQVFEFNVGMGSVIKGMTQSGNLSDRLFWLTSTH